MEFTLPGFDIQMVLEQALKNVFRELEKMRILSRYTKTNLLSMSHWTLFTRA